MKLLTEICNALLALAEVILMFSSFYVVVIGGPQFLGNMRGLDIDLWGILEFGSPLLLAGMPVFIVWLIRNLTIIVRPCTK